MFSELLLLNVYQFPLNSQEEGTETKKNVCVEVLRPSQLNGVMSSTTSLSNHTFTGQA